MSALDDKLNARARIQLATGELPEDLEVMLRLKSELTAEQEQALSDAGCELKSRAGNVVVARSPRDCLQRLANYPFVERIDVSQQLHQEDGGPSG